VPLRFNAFGISNATPNFVGAGGLLAALHVENIYYGDMSDKLHRVS